MADQYPGLSQDCLDLIKRCYALIDLGVRCRAACFAGDPVTGKALMDDIRLEGPKLGDFASGFCSSYFDIDVDAATPAAQQG